MKTIAIASGKGGVGKSTVANILATMLASNQLKIGILDADVYGPSQSGLLGASATRCDLSADGKIIPAFSNGVYFVSVTALVDDDQPLIWRAPMATRLITDFLQRVAWPEDLDYLIIDLPPGTGDIQLTLAQQADLSGAIIVTTPQRVAYQIAEKAIQMFEKLKVPIIGLVENMSGYLCEHCGHENQIFKQGGGELLANKYQTTTLAKIPLDPLLVTCGDDGATLSAVAADHPVKRQYQLLAEHIIQRNESLDDGIKALDISDNNSLTITWHNGSSSTISAYTLRSQCPCASCVDEISGNRTLSIADVPVNITIKACSKIGRYGVKVQFSDSHNTGIYTHQLLQTIANATTVKSLTPEFQV